MTITVDAYSGSTSITTAEYFLPNASTTATAITTPGMWQAFFDLSALVDGDKIQFTVYETTVSAGTQVVYSKQFFTNQQTVPAVVHPPLILGNGWNMSLKMISATARTIPWRISSVT